MKFSKKIIVTLCIFTIVICGFIIAHINPSMSIRAHLFIYGHPIGAFRGNIKTMDSLYKADKDMLDKENAMVYPIEGYTEYDRLTGNVISNYKVKKMGFLYFTETYGEG